MCVGAHRGPMTDRMRLIVSIIAMLTGVCTAPADIPGDYYNSLDGCRGDALVMAIRDLAASHRVITYGAETWDAFRLSDIRIVNGRDAWYDMYSNRLVWCEEHASLNIEHSVANSWWGGKNGSTEAYSDLFHLNPSDQAANARKSNYPPGIVEGESLFDNGLLRIGKPVYGMGGGASNVFEPADEYKGDFARAYFYIFSTYPDIPWREDLAYVADSEGHLKPWAIDLLLKWHREDPVDSKEINRNEVIFEIQGNRNPFIDFPRLAEFIWGMESGNPISVSALEPSFPIDRPSAPVFRHTRLTAVNTYATRWWESQPVDILFDEGELRISFDGGPYFHVDNPALPHATGTDETHELSAYSVMERDGFTLRSPISRLTCCARNPETHDWSSCRWEKVMASTPPSSTEGPYIITSRDFRIMSATGGTSSTAYMPCSDFVEIDGDIIIELPVDAAIIRFSDVGNGKTRLEVSDIFGKELGYWNATAKNKMRLDPVTYTPGTIEINRDNTFSFSFDRYGTLQYNASQPRFLNYESSQQPVYLYRYKDEAGGWTDGIETPDDEWCIGIEGDTIIPSPDAKIFDLSGRPVEGRNLTPGIYIVVGSRGTRKISL